jgi:hypothetical protein
MTTPADEVHAAANRLLALAEAVDHDIATNPYWSVERPQPHAHAPLYARGIDRATPAAAAFAAAMHPGVAAAIAAWLQVEAFQVMHNGRSIATTHHALAVARQINGTGDQQR